MAGRPSAHGGAEGPPPGPGPDGGAAARHPWSPLDDALGAYRAGDRGAAVGMRTDVGGAEDVPAALFFRTPEEMGPVERAALDLARGRVLDVGAGPGAHALPLARSGLPVTALEILPQALAGLRSGGVADVREGGLETVGPDERFDTVLLLMNGLGLAGTRAGLGPFLGALEALLAEGGRILADSTDPRGWDVDEDGRYAGEVHMQLGFAGAWGEPFPFLFVDADTLREIGASLGLEVALAAEEADGRYLAVITRAATPAR